MALFKATAKMNHSANGVRIEKGMSVDFPCQSGSPFSNGGKELNEAFIRKYGLDLKKGGVLSSSYLEVIKIN
jgi:hypothetical protein